MGNLRFETYRDAFASPLTPSSTVFAYRHIHVSLLDNLISHCYCVITRYVMNILRRCLASAQMMLLSKRYVELKYK
jgi:hypothetical protein